MARRTAQERASIEQNYQVENSKSDSICEGKHYVSNAPRIEICKHRESCSKYSDWLERLQSNKRLYDVPRVQFYYVDSFRKCTLFQSSIQNQTSSIEP